MNATEENVLRLINEANEFGLHGNPYSPIYPCPEVGKVITTANGTFNATASSTTGELNLVSGLRTNGRDNQYIFGGKIILSAFMVQNNSLGVININISNKEVKVGEDFSNIPDDELIDKKQPLTQLVFKDRDSIDIMIEQLTLIRNKLNK